jgi:hypothetical protein
MPITCNRQNIGRPSHHVHLSLVEAKGGGGGWPQTNLDRQAGGHDSGPSHPEPAM